MKSLFKIYIYQLNSSLQSLSGIQNYECTFDYEHRGKRYFFELTNNSPSPLPTLSAKKKETCIQSWHATAMKQVAHFLCKTHFCDVNNPIWY